MNHTLIIAEAGVNHNGSIDMAKGLIDVAADAGVDYVKFQTFKAENLVTKYAVKAEYQQRNMDDNDNSQYAMLKKLEFSSEQHFELIEYCVQKGVGFFSTAFDFDSVDFLASLHLGLWKIPSGEITNYHNEEDCRFSSACNSLHGYEYYGRDERRLSMILTKFGVQKEQIIVLHCNTEYPTPFEDVNLRAMLTIKEELGVRLDIPTTLKA